MQDNFVVVDEQNTCRHRTPPQLTLTLNQKYTLGHTEQYGTTGRKAHTALNLAAYRIHLIDSATRVMAGGLPAVKSE